MQDKESTVPVIFIILLYLLFALVALAMVTIGGKVYKNLSLSMNDNYDMRTGLAYVATKVRQGDGADCIHLAALADGATGSSSPGIALVLEETYEETTYQTWIYFFQGALYEIYIEEGLDFLPEDGSRLMELADFQIEMPDQGTIKLQAQNQRGKSGQLVLCLRSGLA